MSTRERYLNEIWRRYPPAPADAIDVAAFWEAGRARAADVCGRWDPSPGGGWLTSGGYTVLVTFAPTLKTLDGSGEFSREWLADGDVVCLRLKPEANDTTIAEAVELLVPSEGEYKLPGPKFDFGMGERWTAFLDGVRGFFRERGFTEALTPTLVPSPGTEPFLDPFHTEWSFGSSSVTRYLPTSPEFHLKKMLVAGWTRLFEFKTCFRNGELGAHHQPEFLMLEWYRAYADLDRILRDTRELLAHLGAPPAETTTMTALFARAFDGFRLTPTTTLDQLVSLARQVGTHVEPSDSWDEVFFRLFLEHIETKLGIDAPLVVRGYPPTQAALARIGADGFADRFELYWRGLEIANAFHELNDPAENVERFRSDNRAKVASGREEVPIDQELEQALRFGLPPSGGIALGLDRLFMALNGIERIEDTRAFPVRAP